jgi:uncharacterized protein
MNYQMKYHLAKIRKMKRKNFRILIIALSFLFSAPLLFSQEIPERPNPPRLVNDFTGTLSNNQINQLERSLVQFNNQTSNQITVVLVKSLNGIDKAEFAYSIGEQWKVGQKEFNNGIVILVKPKTSREKGQAFIAPGYGLEGAIPDATAKLIVENEMIPLFQNNDYFGGIVQACKVIIPLAQGEFSSDEYAETSNQGSPFGAIVPFIIMIIIFVLMRGSRARSHSVGGALPFWTAMMLGSSIGRGSSGSWNNFSSGSGGFGGGGGFGGFGGGSFGGGGAGGSW